MPAQSTRKLEEGPPEADEMPTDLIPAPAPEPQVCNPPVTAVERRLPNWIRAGAQQILTLRAREGAPYQVHVALEGERSCRMPWPKLGFPAHTYCPHQQLSVP